MAAAIVTTSLVAALTAPTDAATRATRSWDQPISFDDSAFATLVTIGVEERGRIRDLDVSVRGLSHTFPADIDLLLVGPTGVAVPLLSDACSDQDFANATLRFDDEGGPITCGVSQTLQPVNVESGVADEWGVEPSATTLSAFDDTGTRGHWQLWITDDAPEDPGLIDGGWAVHFIVERLDVKLTRKPKRITSSRTARFAFRSVPAAPEFSCSLDGSQPRRCDGRKTYRKLKPGRHVFRVKATGDFGQPGSAVHRWRIRR